MISIRREQCRSAVFRCGTDARRFQALFGNLQTLSVQRFNALLVLISGTCQSDETKISKADEACTEDHEGKQGSQEMHRSICHWSASVSNGEQARKETGLLACKRKRSVSLLFNDLDDAPGSRLDENSTTIDDGVPILPHAILGRHFVVLNAGFRQHGANAYIFVIAVGWNMSLDNIGAEARTLVDTKDAGDATSDPANDTSDHSAYRAGCSFAVPCSLGSSSRNALRVGRYTQQRNEANRAGKSKHL